jgi:thiol-disulfide isomerase/thioredoxin
MRSITLFICLLFFGESLIAQDAFSFNAEAIPEITGTLTGYDHALDSGMIIKYAVVTPSPERQVEKTTRPNPDGTFSLTLDYPIRRTQIWMHLGDYYYGQLIVDRGLRIQANLDSLRKLDGVSFDSKYVSFTGPDGPLTAYMNQFTTYEIARRPGNNPLLSILRDRESPPDEKWQRLENELFDHKKLVIDSFLQEYPSEYGNLLYNNWQSERLGWMFPIYRGQDIPESLQKQVQEHAPELFTNAGILNFVNYQIGRFFGWTDEERFSALETIAEEENLSANRRQAIHDLLAMHLQQQEDENTNQEAYKDLRKQVLDDVDSLLYVAQVNRFRKKLRTVSNSEVRDLIRLIAGGDEVWKRHVYTSLLLPDIENDYLADVMERQWKSNKDKLKRIEESLASIKVIAKDGPLGEELGTMDNGTRMIQATDQSLDDLLASLRKDIGNKPMLIDLWATWCGPCIADMRESKPNIEKLREMGVEVVYLCTTEGSSTDAWKSRVAQFDLPTRHIYLTDAQSTEIMKKFNLRGFPSHLFFDADGQYYPDVVHSIGRADTSVFEEYLGN